MRICSLHQKYLDRQGLLACWRKALLMQKVLKGETKGHHCHPQLARFGACPDPMAAIATYLESLAEKAERRGYIFCREKITATRLAEKIPVTPGQVFFEREQLKTKLAPMTHSGLLKFL